MEADPICLYKSFCVDDLVIGQKICFSNIKSIECKREVIKCFKMLQIRFLSTDSVIDLSFWLQFFGT